MCASVVLPVPRVLSRRPVCFCTPLLPGSSDLYPLLCSVSIVISSCVRLVGVRHTRDRRGMVYVIPKVGIVLVKWPLIYLAACDARQLSLTTDSFGFIIPRDRSFPVDNYFEPKWWNKREKKREVSGTPADSPPCRCALAGIVGVDTVP